MSQRVLFGIYKDEAWTKKAAELGSADAQRSYSAILNNKGALEEAARWLSKAAEQGDASDQYNHGINLLVGKGMQKNEDQAAVFLEKAAKQGHALAQINIGAFCMFGLYGKQTNMAQDNRMVHTCDAQT